MVKTAAVDFYNGFIDMLNIFIQVVSAVRKPFYF